MASDKPSKALDVPSEPTEPKGQKAVQLEHYLYRWVPYWGAPQWLQADRWRHFVKNQSIAVICRDTLINNVLSMDWTLAARQSKDMGREDIREAIEFYTDLLEHAEGDFDTYVELMLQDMLDLPFGAAAEIGRENDDPEGPVVWIEHIDGGTLVPTANPDYPVMQSVKEVPGRTTIFPKHAISRMFMSPRPEITRSGWGMAPPEKVYLAIEMLFRGDKYYSNLLLDTPEAGILDLMDMDEESAGEWLDSFRSLFQGIDGMKVPVLYGHDKAAQWIPLNRPPIDMMYDSVTLRYAQIVAAGYGMRLSDIGMDEMGGEKTLAGVIRGERQTRRNGFALVRSKLENHFNSIVPKEIRFTWVDDDSETKLANGKALVAIGQGLTQLVTASILERSEARHEIVAQGLLKTDIDPDATPEEPPPPPPNPFGAMGGSPFGNGGQPGAKPAFPMDGEDEKVPPSSGGRGGLTPILTRSKPRPDQKTRDQLIAEMEALFRPGIEAIGQSAEDIRVRRLVKATVRAMVPTVQRIFTNMDDDTIERLYLPQMEALEADEPSDLNEPVVIRANEDIKAELDKHLADDPWWRTLSKLEKTRIVAVLARSYSVGLQDMALAIVRSLYEEGLRSSPELLGMSFDLVNKKTLKQLSDYAADLVRWVDDGTKYYIKRVVMAGVRQGLARPQIARALRDGVSADWILSQEDFMGDVLEFVQRGLTDMSKRRTQSIVETEVNRAENMGRLGQLTRSGLTQKVWVHRGKEGVSEAGNVHPCPICKANEELGFVPMDYQYETVFTKRTGERSPTPPAHPEVCHCEIDFNSEELLSKLSTGDYMPWLGK
jgi:hypothetical protein